MIDQRPPTRRCVTRKPLRAVLWMLAAFTLLLDTTHAAPPDTTRIWRAQVRFITANVGDAGTDSSVKIELNGANRTWLDSGRDDRERNTDETFDLRLDGVTSLSDIDYLRIEKTGDDGWAIARMYLIVNERVIYQEDFPPVWLDNEDGHARVYLIDDTFMRPRAEWANYAVPTRPNVVPLNDMRLRMEALSGDFATMDYAAHHSNGYDGVLMAKFGSYSVEPYTLYNDTWRVDLDFEADGTFFDLDIDADFDLRVSCSNNRPDLIVSNINVSTTADLDWDEADRTRSFVANDMRPRLNQMMKNFSFLPFCPAIVLAPNGDLHFDPQFPPIGDITEVLDDSFSPLDAHVITGDIRSYAQADFTATVKSKLDQETPMDLTIELPALIEAYDTLVEVNEGRQRRYIDAKLVRNDKGGSALVFSDVLPAGQNTVYTLHLTYLPKEDGLQQIVTNIEPGRDLEKIITPLRAVSYFQFAKETVLAEGTTILSSTYVENQEPDKDNGGADNEGNDTSK